MNDPANNGDLDERVARLIDNGPRLARLWSLFGIMLVTATWRLWFPLSAAGYPAVGLIPWVSQEYSQSVLWVASIIVLLGLAVTAWRAQRCRWCWILVSLGMMISFAVDQHRMQPWAYQLAIYGLVFASMPPRSARRVLVPLAASVYIFSAMGKLDYQFAHTIGQDFLETTLAIFGGVPESWDESVRSKVALGFPLLELLAGIGLLVRPIRPIAGVAVMVMHAILILILGPWGLDQSWGVLVWNAALMAQAYELMVRPRWAFARPIDCESPPLRCIEALRIPAIALVTLTLVAPFFERSGYWDHWLSWSLYSPHTSRVVAQVHGSSIDELPASLKRHLDDDSDGDRWYELDFAAWSLAERQVPIYPQARYQLGLVHRVADEASLGESVRVQMRSASDRWTGRRDETMMLGQEEVRRELDRFWLGRP